MNYDLNKINPSTLLRVDAERAKRVERIKFATDEAMYQRAVDLYESPKRLRSRRKIKAREKRNLKARLKTFIRLLLFQMFFRGRVVTAH